MKSRYYIWVLIVLLLVSVYFLKDNWSTTGNDFDRLIPKAIEVIDHISIQNDSEILDFIKSEDQWTYKGEVVNQKAVENLLLAAGRLSMKSIVSIDDIKDVDFEMGLVFKHGNKVSGAFTLIRSAKNYYIFSTASKHVYGIELIGFENIPLEKIFSSEVDHFREHLLLNLLPSEIKEVQIRPLKGSQFSAYQDEEQIISVRSQDDKDLSPIIDERKLRLLFSYFTVIRYNSIMHIGETEIDSASSALIRVRDIYENEYKLEVFPWYRSGLKKPDMFEALVVFNDKAEILSVDYYYLDLLLRGLEKYLKD